MRSLNVKTVLFHPIRFSICTQFSSIWPIDRTRSDATTPGQSGPRSNGKEGVSRIPQSSRIIGTSPSDCLVSILGHSLGGFTLCKGAVGIFYSPSLLGSHGWVVDGFQLRVNSSRLVQRNPVHFAFEFAFLKRIFTQWFDIKHFNLIQIILTKLYGFKYFHLILIIAPQAKKLHILLLWIFILTGQFG